MAPSNWKAPSPKSCMPESEWALLGLRRDLVELQKQPEEQFNTTATARDINPTQDTFWDHLKYQQKGSGLHTYIMHDGDYGSMLVGNSNGILFSQQQGICLSFEVSSIKRLYSRQNQLNPTVKQRPQHVCSWRVYFAQYICNGSSGQQSLLGPSHCSLTSRQVTSSTAHGHTCCLSYLPMAIPAVRHTCPRPYLLYVIPAQGHTCCLSYLPTAIPAVRHTCPRPYLLSVIPAHGHTCIPSYLPTAIPAVRLTLHPEPRI